MKDTINHNDNEAQRHSEAENRSNEGVGSAYNPFLSN